MLPWLRVQAVFSFPEGRIRWSGLAGHIPHLSCPPPLHSVFPSSSLKASTFPTPLHVMTHRSCRCHDNWRATSRGPSCGRLPLCCACGCLIPGVRRFAKFQPWGLLLEKNHGEVFSKAKKKKKKSGKKLSVGFVPSPCSSSVHAL